jgi:hypothetical protein
MRCEGEIDMVRETEIVRKMETVREMRDTEISAGDIEISTILAHRYPLRTLEAADRIRCAFNFQIMFRRFFFLFGALLLMVQGVSVHHYSLLQYCHWRIIR